MIDNDLKESILNSISLTGSVVEENAKQIPLAAVNSAQILDVTSGMAKIKPSLVKQFHLILAQPPALAEMSNLSIRCTLCGKVISYPAWYHSVKYAVNVFHFFVCFDANSHTKPSVRCYRKG